MMEDKIFTHNSHFLQKLYIYKEYINNHKHPLFFKSYSVKKIKKQDSCYILQLFKNFNK